MEQECYVDAADYYKKALSEKKNDISSLKGMMRAYNAAGNDMEFSNTATELINKTGGDCETYLMLAEYYYSMGQLDKAYSYIEMYY